VATAVASKLKRLQRKFAVIINYVFHHARCTCANALDYLTLHNLRAKKRYADDALFLVAFNFF
jgi:hypothetical protein